jgi:Transposase DNA-binding/Transposase Tn5 dimerisation domain
MATTILDCAAWAEQQFGTCALGDARRTRRTVTLAAHMAAHPSGSTPQQTEGWNECRAAYRLLDAADVTYRALTAPHCRQTRAAASGHWLLLNDTTEVDFGIHRQVAGLGPTGDGGGQGFFLHSALMVAAGGADMPGLAAQELFHRRPRPQGESRYDRTLRPRESEVWGRLIDEIGPPPPGARFTHVCDRGADNFEVYCHLLQQQADWVIRASHLNRLVLAADGSETALENQLGTLPLLGTYELSVTAQRKRRARTARVEVRAGTVIFRAPRLCSPWLKQQAICTIAMNVIEVREVRPPRDVEPLRWVLYTSHPADTFAKAWEIIGWYEQRPLIEEYHKALKSGCQVESRQLRTAARLEAAVGLAAVVAVRLLQLKSVARDTPEQPASRLIPPQWLRVLRKVRRAPRAAAWTVRDFYRHLAGFGGFLGRKGDGEPGWMTLWRGFDKLALLLRHADQPGQECG